MDSDENKQNLDLKKEDIKENQDLNQNGKNEDSKTSSIADSNKEDNKEEKQSQGKNTSRIPMKIIVPAAIAVIAVVVIIVFLIHPAAKTTLISAGYTPIRYLSNSGLDSVIGGNWSLVLNQTANSTVVNEYAGTGDFPQGTVAAAIQEFVPYSEVSQIAAGNSSNISSFVSTVYYLNSSSDAGATFNELGSISSADYKNDSKVAYNLSTIGNASMFYINGKLNSSNSSTENATEIYMLKGKSLVIVTASNENLGYSQAKNIVNYLFS